MENVQVETVISLELNISETNLILGALRELPHRVSDDLIKKVIAQAQKTVPQPPQE
jgi:hypothetical protein